MDWIEEFFYGVFTTIYVAWDPQKDPLIPNSPGLDHQNLAISSIEKLLSYCRKQIKALVTLFRSLEELLKKADLMRPSLFRAGPKGKKLSEDIKVKKNAFNGTVA